MENRRFTMTYLSSHFPKISKIFRSLLHKIVTEHILFRKLSARWVPKQLTPEHKAKRMESALELLQRYYDDGEFLDRITTVMKRGSHKLPQKPSSNQSIWRLSGSPCKTKFKQTLSARRVMCMVFWDRRGILLVNFLTRGEKVNTERYCESLQKLRRTIQNKRRVMLSAGVVFLHDNARPHTARWSSHLLQEFSW